MKKTRNPMKYALALSLLGGLFPANRNLVENPLERKTLECSPHLKNPFPINDSRQGYTKENVKNIIKETYKQIQ